MAFEKPDSTQICTWAPPLPQRAYQIQAAGVTSDGVSLGGTAVNGVRYGYFLLNTTQWQTLSTVNIPPVNVGERFQLYTTGTAATNSNTFGMPAAFFTGNVTSGLSSNTNTLGASAPDLYNVTGMIYSDQYALKDPTLCNIVSVRQNSTNSWYVYYAPYNSALTVNALKDGIVTIPELSQPRWLGQIGHVSAINYGYALPGGPDQLTCQLNVEPDIRTDAMNPGRYLTAYRGGSCIWEGILTEPQPSSTCWTLTANGVGTYGTNFTAWWQIGDALSWNADRVLEYAIARGLRWNLPGINSPGLYLGPQQQSGSITITDFMNLLCTGGALTWQLIPSAGSASFPPRPWEIEVVPLPTDSSGYPIAAAPSSQLSSELFTYSRWARSDLNSTITRNPPDLYIINTSPIGRTIAADYNTVVVYYQVTADTTATSTTAATSATYQTTYADIPASVAQHGRLEYYLDVSSAGVMTQPQASAIAINVLSKYVRANFTGSFTVQPGQLLNVGGAPVDLGCNWGGYMASLQVENFAYGGEVAFGPITFQIGEYVYDDDTQTATVTPYQNARTDISSVISQLYPGKFS